MGFFHIYTQNSLPLVLRILADKPDIDLHIDLSQPQILVKNLILAITFSFLYRFRSYSHTTILATSALDCGGQKLNLTFTLTFFNVKHLYPVTKRYAGYSSPLVIALVLAEVVLRRGGIVSVSVLPYVHMSVIVYCPCLNFFKEKVQYILRIWSHCRHLETIFRAQHPGR